MTRFTYRHVNQITGVFVLLALLVVGGGIYMAARAQHWFEPTDTINLLLPEEGSFGLTPGAAVITMGTHVGEVTDIHVRDDGRMTTRATVRRDFARFIGADCHATIKKTFGVAGDAFIEITGGGGRPLPPGALIEVVVDRAPMDMFQEVVSQIRTEILPAIQDLRLAAQTYRQLASDINAPAVKALNRIEAIGAKIDKGDGLLPRMLADKQMADDVSGAIGRVNTTLDETRAAVKELRAVAAQLGKSAGKFHETVEQLPTMVRQVNTTLDGVRKITENLVRVTGSLPATLDGVHKVTDNLVRVTDSMPETLDNVNQTVKSLAGLIAQTQTTLREIQRLVEGAQRHWLVREYISDDKPDGRIAPKDVVISP